MTRVFLSFLALTTGTFGATLTATLKPATVNLGKSATLTPVSYTHLTLPTICSV